MKDQIGAEIEIVVDSIELAALEIEAIRRGVSVSEIATEKLAIGIDKKFKSRPYKCRCKSKVLN